MRCAVNAEVYRDDERQTVAIQHRDAIALVSDDGNSHYGLLAADAIDNEIQTAITWFHAGLDAGEKYGASRAKREIWTRYKEFLASFGVW